MREKANERVCGEKGNMMSKARLNGASESQAKIEYVGVREQAKGKQATTKLIKAINE